MTIVLSTKILDDATLVRARLLNLAVQGVDFIETRAFDFNLVEASSFDTVAFTSANAVKHFFEKAGAASLIKGKSIYALQGRTEDVLTKRGALPKKTAHNAAGLADLILESGSAKSVLHPSGNLRLDRLEMKLGARGVGYIPLLVYKTVFHSDIKVAEPADAVMFYSPSGIESFFVKNDISNKTVCCCIGETTANALKEKRKEANIILPKEPSPVSMIDAIHEHFSSK